MAMEKYRPVKLPYFDHIAELIAAVGGSVDIEDLREIYRSDADYVQAAIEILSDPKMFPGRSRVLNESKDEDFKGDLPKTWWEFDFDNYIFDIYSKLE